MARSEHTTEELVQGAGLGSRLDGIESSANVDAEGFRTRGLTPAPEEG